MIGITTDKPEKICSDHFLLRIDVPNVLSSPGQFVNIRIGDQTDPLLRRPFSIHNHKDNIIEIVFRVVGKGTRLLSNYENLGKVDIIAPLGNGFTLIEGGRALIIGGGVGNAPLYYLAELLKRRDIHVTFLYGARSKEYVYLQNKYESVASRFVLTTDDGTDGRKGIVSDVAEELFQKEDFDIIYVCGPNAMIGSVIDLLNKLSIPTPIEISVETYFGCGIGICYGCTIDTLVGQKRACVDGPVFDGRIIRWDAFQQSQ
ncbi:MAG: dihydroorotate dehydrogenase electron transfer subunit [Spirochaetota bacterium]|nr:dihydroorotate dehydrogenase electron transfer subunit [Spirochaetota bacterium]